MCMKGVWTLDLSLTEHYLVQTNATIFLFDKSLPFISLEVVEMVFVIF